MKLTPTWSIEEDHNPARGTSLIGRLVCCYTDSDDPSPGYLLSTLHIIGYDGLKDKKDDGYYTFVSLGDGMTYHYTLDRLIEVLNGQPYIPASNTSVIAALNFKVAKK